MPNDAKVAPDTQNNACADNPLADGCQAGAGFLSVNLGEDIGNQEAEPSVAPPTPEPVVSVPVVKKTEPVLEELAKKKTPPAPAPITSVDTHDFTPKTSPSTQSAPAEQRSGSAVSGQSHPVDNAITVADWVDSFTSPALPTMRDTSIDDKGTSSRLDDTSNQRNQFLQASKRTIEVRDTQGALIRTENRIGLDRMGAVRADPLRMNLAQATFDGVAIGGDEEDGIDFFIASTFTAKDEGFFRVGLAGTLRADKQVNVDTLYHYAGILSGTDLGAPVEPTDPTATWNGSFRTHNTNAVDFQLTVTFGATDQDRTISAFVKDNARWGAVDNYYLLAGTYTDAGVITGTVNWGTFSDIAQRTPTSNRPTNGVLTGLIGVEGAVAVFTSNTPASRTIGFGEDPPIDNTQNIITGKVFNNVPPVYGYVGGFVAAPSDIARGNTDVRFRDWTRAIPTVTGGNNGFEAGGAYGLGQTAIPNVISRADCEVRNAIFSSTDPLTGMVTAINQTDCDLTDSGSLNLADVRFEEFTRSGVAFVTEGISLTTLTSGKSFAGLLSGTDLGAPITSADQVGEWQGQFKSIGGYYYGINPDNESARISTAFDTDFTLEVTFGAVGGVDGSAGSIEAFVATHGISRYFLLKGTYDDKGVITGTVLAGLFDNHQRSNPSATINGVLTGLIGVEGAVGAFVSNADNYNYAGGFVANAITPDTEREVTFGDWTRSFATAPALAPTTGTPQSEFLQTTGGTLATGDLTVRGGGAITVTTLDLNTAQFKNNPLGSDAEDGVAFYQGYVNNDGAGYAGIFSTTDLGRPISPGDARAEWRGQFQVIESRKIKTDFTLEVTFGAVAGVDGSVGKVEAFVEQIAPNAAHHYVRGTFNAAGVIKGTAIAGGFTNGDRNQFNGGATDGILTGLIGEDGAVGAFYSQAGVYAGGFVAQPTDLVTYADWLDSFGNKTLQTAGRPTAGLDSEFLQSGPIELNVGTIEGTFNGTDNAIRNLTTLTMDSNTDNGVSFFSGIYESLGGVQNLNRHRFYAGILSGTNVGLPLAPYVSGGDETATWNGQLQLVHFRKGGGTLTGVTPQKRDIELVVDFENSRIEVFEKLLADASDNHHILLEAGYNSRGQFINGTVKYGSFPGNSKTATRVDLDGPSDGTSGNQRPLDGRLTGIIGQEGAVGAFINDIVPEYGFAGGFVASP